MSTQSTPNVIKVVGIETDNLTHDNGRDFAKQLPPGSRYRYHLNVVYIGDDGSRHDGTVRGLTKPKLKASLERMHHYVKHGMLRYEQIGDLWHQMISFSP